MDYFSGWCKSERRLAGCTAIVTGSNTGLGKETARDLYLRGARVILACRNTEKADIAKQDIEATHSEIKGTVTVEKLDLTSLESVRQFVKRILKNEREIHILVNNAGVMCCPQSKTEDGFETHMGTNHFGHALLTLLLLPRLIKNAPSRIVNVSSYLHISGNIDFEDINFEKNYNPLIAYSRSKAANILFTKALANQLMACTLSVVNKMVNSWSALTQPSEHNIENVSAYSVHPGVISTEIGRNFSTTMFYGFTWLFQNVLSWFTKSPKCGAQTAIYCAVDENCADESGLYYVDCQKTSPSKFCQSEENAAKLWSVTMEALKLQEYDPFGANDPLL